MKNIILLFLTLISFMPLEGQHQIQLDWNKNENSFEDTKSNFALTYIRPGKAQSGTAFRLSFLTTGKRERSYARRTNMFQLDIAERWYTNKGKKIRLFVEIGFSGMLLNEETSRYFDDLYYPISCVNCYSIGYVEQEQDEHGVNYKRKDRRYLLSFLPGGTGAVGLAVDVMKHIYLGLSIRKSGYYALSDQDIYGYNYLDFSGGWKF